MPNATDRKPTDRAPGPQGRAPRIDRRATATMRDIARGRPGAGDGMSRQDRRIRARLMRLGPDIANALALGATPDEMAILALPGEGGAAPALAIRRGRQWVPVEIRPLSPDMLATMPAAGNA